jgi:4-alpha-glucanotransferase
MIRLDHFRGFAAAWHVPAGAVSARSGEWVPGPGAEVFAAVATELGALPFIAEDLGLVTADVQTLRDRFQLPRMRVLQFAFDGNSDNPHLPGNFVSNTVVYTGTHDNPTTRGWFEQLPDRQKQYFWSYLRLPAGDSSNVGVDGCALVSRPITRLQFEGGAARPDRRGPACRCAEQCACSWRAGSGCLRAAVNTFC